MSTTDWTAFSLWPDDVLFFRDGKPSTVGEDHYLRSLFPPHPTTLYGAVRTRRLLDDDVDLKAAKGGWNGLSDDLKAELGPWGGFGQLELRGPWFVRRLPDLPEEVLLPAPQDLCVIRNKPEVAQKVRPKDDPPRVEHAYRYLCEETACTDADRGWSHSLGLWQAHAKVQTVWTPFPPESGHPETESTEKEPEPEPAAGWYLTPDGIAAWAAGDVPEPKHFVHHTELWLDEPRTGVGLRPEARGHQDGLLYTFGFIRLRKHIGLGFELRNSGLESGGALRLGGEGRMARLDAGPPLPLPAVSPAPGQPFHLAFATPALSASGALPPGLGKATGTGPLTGADDSGSYRALGGILKTPQLIGGWDLAANRAKALRRAIPAGSVFRLQPTDPAHQAALSGKNLSDFTDQALARQGFGLALVGLDPRRES
jgi:CRISPR-associated protein Cmr3